MEDWHARFQQQAAWTQPLRDYLFSRISIETQGKVLDVGCGTGVLEPELTQRANGQVAAVDLELEQVRFAARNAPGVAYAAADGHNLPFLPGSFGLSLCHFLLLWVKDPVQVLHEMKRVTRSGGVVLALAEPDYGGRIDYPTELSVLGEQQQASLLRQGANPTIGRSLASLFVQAGLKSVESGVLGGQWSGLTTSQQDELLEWAVLEADLERSGQTPFDLERLRAIDRDSRIRGDRILYTPTFYALGKVP